MQDPVDPLNHVLRLSGVVTSRWAALACRPQTFSRDFVILAKVYNSSDPILPGGHQVRGLIGLRTGTHWTGATNPSRDLALFRADGKIVAGPTIVGAYDTARWYDIAVHYRRNAQDVSLEYWLDGAYLSTITLPIPDQAAESSFDDIELSSQAGTAYFDDIMLYDFSVESSSSRLPVAAASDDFEDGVINKDNWVVGGAARGWLQSAPIGDGNWSYSHEEIQGPDGYLSARVFGPASERTYGAEAWVRTRYNFNDGKAYRISFKWEANPVLQGHQDFYYIQVTDGFVPPRGDVHWLSRRPPLPPITQADLAGTGDLLYDEMPGQSPTGRGHSLRNMSIRILPEGVCGCMRTQTGRGVYFARSSWIKPSRGMFVPSSAMPPAAVSPRETTDLICTTSPLPLKPRSLDTPKGRDVRTSSTQSQPAIQCT